MRFRDIEQIIGRGGDCFGVLRLKLDNKQFIADTIVYIEYLIYEAKFHLVLIQMMSNLSLDIVISPQMCYNTL